MNEYEFIEELQKRASEQKRALSAMPLPRLYAVIVGWLGSNPWRFLIPSAIAISILLRFAVGTKYTDFILWIFRKI